MLDLAPVVDLDSAPVVEVALDPEPAAVIEDLELDLDVAGPEDVDVDVADDWTRSISTGHRDAAAH